MAVAFITDVQVPPVPLIRDEMMLSRLSQSLRVSLAKPVTKVTLGAALGFAGLPVCGHCSALQRDAVAGAGLEGWP